MSDNCNFTFGIETFLAGGGHDFELICPSFLLRNKKLPKNSIQNCLQGVKEVSY